MDINKLIGHRGFAGLRPENTLCGFSFSAEFGLKMVEFDIQLTNDEEWVVIHDLTIDRTTNQIGNVRDYSLQDLIKLDAGLWYDPPYPDQFIPSLLDTINLSAALGIATNIEIKGSNDDSERHATLISRFIKQHFAVQQDLPLVSSFDLACLIELRAQFPSLPIAYLVDEISTLAINECSRHNFKQINCDANKLTVESLAMANTMNLPVYIYTVNDKETAEYWLAQGVARIFTDRADLLLAP